MEAEEENAESKREKGKEGEKRKREQGWKNSRDVGHFPLTKCLHPQYVPRVPGMSP